MRNMAIQHGLMVTAALSAMATMASPAQAQARAFSIPKQAAAQGIPAFGRQAGIKIVARGRDVVGKRTNAVFGVLDSREALRRLLAGTGLVADDGSDGIVTVRAAARPIAPVALGADTAASGIDAADGAAADQPEDPIVVTGSRIERAGFDQPTPTTVIGADEIRQGARSNIAQVLNDQPQFRQTLTPASSIGNGASGIAPVDLRGLGIQRTLTLLDGRRFVSSNNLNMVPQGLVQRVEVVTGGASAAWGSDAVAGVVNIILKDDLEGLTIGAQSGISSRGDGSRYGFDASFGTKFAGGNGTFIIGAEYVDERGVRDRNSRRNLGSAGIVRLNPTSATDLRVQLVPDVNDGYQSRAGLIISGVLAGQTFNPDGTLRPFRGGARVGAAAFPAQMIGGEDGVGLYDHFYATTPFDRLNLYARATYDIGNATLWADASYGRSSSNYVWAPDITITPFTVSASNPFLSSSIRNQLAAAGETSFTFGRVFMDVFPMEWDSRRVSKEGAIGIRGSFGNGWKYSAHYSHGEVRADEELRNVSVRANFARAINAVSSGGQIVCAVNADAITTNDDPACRPLNPFGEYNASPEALAYVRATQGRTLLSRLDATAVEVQGDLFSTWAGPVTVVLGAEARWEKLRSSKDAAAAAGLLGFPLFTADLSGGFNVKEGFAEVAVPLLDSDGVAKLDLNGAARYSDYSTSGGIWSWKAGGTARLFDDLLLRATRSRDIRAANISELFATRRIAIGPLVDQDTAGRLAANPLYNSNPSVVTTFIGGNPDLQPEISKTLTIGASYAPSLARGLNLSVDYYDIRIAGAITSLPGTSLTLACARGSQAACDLVKRDATGTVVEVASNAQNIARFETRGWDFEASYVFPVSALVADAPGTLRIRALATYVDRFIQDTGLTRVDTAGDVGDVTPNSVPHLRGTLAISYQDDRLGIDARARYVGGGKFNHLLTTLVNNDVDARTYIDLGAQVKVADNFTLSASVNNLFDVKLPLTTTGTAHYDTVGRYFAAAVRVKF